MKSKTKIMSIAAASLACVAVAGVGFASWVITNDATASVGGNVQVETVDDKRITIEAKLLDGFNTVSYTADKDYSSTNKWLGYDDSAADEQLVLKLEIKLNAVPSQPVTVLLEQPSYTGYTSCVTANYIANVTQATAKMGNSDIAATDGTNQTTFSIPAVSFTEANTYTVTLEIQLYWGTAFRPASDTTSPVGVNPIQFYDQTYSDTLADAAKTALEALDTNIVESGEDGYDEKTHQYKLTISASSTANS